MEGITDATVYQVYKYFGEKSYYVQGPELDSNGSSILGQVYNDPIKVQVAPTSNSDSSAYFKVRSNVVPKLVLHCLNA